MPVSGEGWELHVERLGLHSRHSDWRTYGRYQVYQDGDLVQSLSGFMCEAIGLGENHTPGTGRRIEAGRYPLFTHYSGNYRTQEYSQDPANPSKRPMPAILLGKTGHRSAILIHPAHPPHLFLSSIGCLNPTAALLPDADMDCAESRARVVALIDSVRALSPAAFASRTDSRIDGAVVVIDGEPMDQLG